MKHEIEKILLENGASLAGFANIGSLYGAADFSGPRNEDSVTGPIDIPRYPVGVSIVLAYPEDVIRNIGDAPTMDYYDAYHRLNNKPG